MTGSELAILLGVPAMLFVVVGAVLWLTGRQDAREARRSHPAE